MLPWESAVRPLGASCTEQEPKGAEAAGSTPGGQQCTGQMHGDATFSPGAPEVAS